MDANPTLVALAQGLPEAHWRGLARVPPQIKTEPRQRPENVKERIVRERGSLNQRLESEQVAEFEYQPGKCKKSYRMVVLRKNLSIERGEQTLFDEIRYFFYIDVPTEGRKMADRKTGVVFSSCFCPTCFCVKIRV